MRRKNKRGQITILMVFILIGLLFSLIFIFIGGVVAVRINETLDRDIDLGQVNLASVNADTFGKFTEMYIANADWWGLSIIFGMVCGLFLSAFMTRGVSPKWGVILDIFIIVVVFITSLYVSSAYSTVLDVLASAGETFLEDYVGNTSRFMIHLPIFVVIIGAIMMFIFHSSIPRRDEERLQSGGYLQGVQ